MLPLSPEPNGGHGSNYRIIKKATSSRSPNSPTRERGQQLSTAFTSLPAFSVQSESLPFQNNRTTELHLLPIPEDRSGLILVNLLNFRAFAESSLVALAVQKEHLSELQLVSMSGPQ